MLNRLGQNLWLDNIMRDMLGGGTLKRQIEDPSVTDLTARSTIFDNVISCGTRYDADARVQLDSGALGEAPVLNFVVQDLSRTEGPFP